MSKSKAAAARSPTPEVESVQDDLASPDEQTRARAVRALCPCRVGTEFFEAHMALVRQAQKDPSESVRAAARHILEDAMEHGDGLPTSRRMVTDEMARTRFRHRWRHEDDGVTEKASAAGGRRRAGR